MAKRSSGVIIDEYSVKSNWENVRLDEANKRFLLLTYSSPNEITLSMQGTGGLVDLIGSLNDDDVYFGGFRINIEGSTKFLSLFFVGSSVNGMKRGKASLHKNAILNILDGCHGEITLNGLDDCKLEDVITKIARLFRIDDISRISF